MKNEIANLTSRLAQIVTDQLKAGKGKLPAEQSDRIIHILNDTFYRLAIDKFNLDVYYKREYFGQLGYDEVIAEAYVSKTVNASVNGAEHQSIPVTQIILLRSFLFKISKYNQEYKIAIEKAIIDLS